MGQTNSTHSQTTLQGQLDVILCSELASVLFSCFSKMVREQEELTASANCLVCWLREDKTHKPWSWLSCLLRKMEGQRMSLFLKIQIKKNRGASLVVQWLRICLPMQGTQVQALVWEDPTCCRAAKPMHHNYWACALEPASPNYWAHEPQLLEPQILKPVCLEPVLCNKRSHRNEEPTQRNKE